MFSLRLTFILLLLLTLFGCGGGTAPSTAPAPQVSPTSQNVEIKESIGFSSRRKWLEHFQKHGREFGSINADEYLSMAQQLRDRPASSDILEATRPDRAFTRYERSTGSFLACNPDRTIRTFFKPRDGERYFRRQLNKPHD